MSIIRDPVYKVITQTPCLLLDILRSAPGENHSGSLEIPTETAVHSSLLEMARDLSVRCTPPRT